MRIAKQRRTKIVEASKVHERVNAQFGPTAAAYSRSLVHSDPAALRNAVELARPKPGDMALAGCGKIVGATAISGLV